jgi:Zn-dependent protease
VVIGVDDEHAATVLHEIAHGYIAYRLGDDTAKLAGRLTLNPISHLDPIGSIVLPLILTLSGLPPFGWAKPVPVNFLKLPDPKRDMIKVAIAGPATNVGLALISALLVHVAMAGDWPLLLGMAMNFLSGVRLAVGLKLVGGLSVYTLNKLLIECQSAHLAYLEGRALTESEANLARARYVRKALASEAGPQG